MTFSHLTESRWNWCPAPSSPRCAWFYYLYSFICSRSKYDLL